VGEGTRIDGVNDLYKLQVRPVFSILTLRRPMASSS